MDMPNPPKPVSPCTPEENLSPDERLARAAETFSFCMKNQSSGFPSVEYGRTLRKGVVQALPGASAAAQRAAWERIPCDESLSGAFLALGIRPPDAILHLVMIAQACERIDLQPALTIARQLVAAGAPLDRPYDYLGVGGFSLVERAVSGMMDPEENAMAWLELWLEVGADAITQVHAEHGPALELALRHDTPACALLLLEHGSPLSSVGPNGWSAPRRHGSVRAAVSAWVEKNRLEQALPSFRETERIPRF